MCDVKVILRHSVVVIIGIFIKLIAVTETSHALCSENDTCLKGWEYSRCSCYLFVHDSLDHATAVRECQQIGAHLVFIDDQQENDFIRNRTSNDTWIGLTTGIVGDKRGCEKNTYCNRENWTLLDDTEASFTNWRIGEPTGDSSCIRMLSSGHWADIACTTSKHYACEMSPISTTVVCTIPNDVTETTVGSPTPVNQPTESGISLLEISIIAGVVVCCLIAVVIIIVLVMKKRSSRTSKSSYQMESGNETNSHENTAVLYKADDHPSNAESRDDTRDPIYMNNHAVLEIPKTYHSSTDVVHAVSVTGGQNGSVIWDEMINNDLYGSTGVNA